MVNLDHVVEIVPLRDGNPGARLILPQILDNDFASIDVLESFEELETYLCGDGLLKGSEEAL